MFSSIIGHNQSFLTWCADLLTVLVILYDRCPGDKYKLHHQKVKLPSLLAAWRFWTFHTKSHNMKALVIRSHSWSHFLPLTCFYGNIELLWVCVWPSGVFSWEKRTPPRLHMQITWSLPPVGSFSHGLITVRQKKMWTGSC